MERRNRTLVPGQLPLQARAPMPVISWYTRFGWFGSTATVGSQLLWCLGSMSYPAGRSSSNRAVATAGEAMATANVSPATRTRARGRIRGPPCVRASYEAGVLSVRVQDHAAQVERVLAGLREVPHQFCAIGALASEPPGAQGTT